MSRRKPFKNLHKDFYGDFYIKIVIGIFTRFFTGVVLTKGIKISLLGGKGYYFLKQKRALLLLGVLFLIVYRLSFQASFQDQLLVFLLALQAYTMLLLLSYCPLCLCHLYEV